MSEFREPATHTWTWEHGGYLAALALALTLRLVALGRFPLSDAEADLALRALDLSRGHPTALGHAPLYTLWTAAVFFLCGATDFTARLVPAVVGSLVVGLPWAWRRLLGREVALGLAWALALDPALVAAGRTAGGTALAVTLTLAAVTWGLRRQWGGALALAGLALLAGRATWVGLLGLGLAAGLAWAGRRWSPASPLAALSALRPAEQAPIGRPSWLSGGLAFLLAATLFGAVPAGAGHLTVGLVDFWRGFTAPSSTPGWVPLLGEALAAPWALLFALVGAATAYSLGRQAPWWFPLGAAWALGALAAIALYPGRQVLDGAWMAAPLWGLAVGGLYLLRGRRPSWALGGQAGAVFLLAVYLWLLLGGGGLSPLQTQGKPWLSWVFVLLDLGLMIGLTVLVALSASLDQALRGALLGLGLALALLTLRGVAQAVAAPPERTLWAQRPASPQVRLLQATLARAGEWAHGRPDTLAIVALRPSPALRWALHGMHTVQVRDQLGPEDLPEALLTPEDQQNLERVVAYRGQDFVLTLAPLWEGRTGQGWVRWYTLGEGRRPEERIILWIRADVFPGGAASNLGAP